MGGKSTVRRRRRIGEVAGGTAAACAAVWCCFPCATLSVLVLALYKVPAGVCRRAWAYSYRKSSKKSEMRKNWRSRASHEGLLLERRPIGPSLVGYGPTTEVWEPTHDAELDDEMWGRFSTSGFWRSPSQRND